MFVSPTPYHTNQTIKPTSIITLARWHRTASSMVPKVVPYFSNQSSEEIQLNLIKQFESETISTSSTIY